MNCFKSALICVSAVVLAVAAADSVDQETYTSVQVEPSDFSELDAVIEAEGPMGQFRWNYSVRSNVNGTVVQRMRMDNGIYRQVNGPGGLKMFENGKRAGKSNDTDLKLVDFNSYAERLYLMGGRSFKVREKGTYMNRSVYVTGYSDIKGFKISRNVNIVEDKVFVDIDTGLILYSVWEVELNGVDRREAFKITRMSDIN